MLMAGAIATLIASAAWSAFAAPVPQTTGRDRVMAPPAQSAPADPAAKQRRDTMMRAMAIDDQVTALTAEMNKATGQAKIDTMARLLTALVEHRSMMTQEMRMMQEDSARSTRQCNTCGR